MSHIHRWRIEEANGPTSEARCECGARRAFWNSLPVDRAGEASAWDAGGRRWKSAAEVQR